MNIAKQMRESRNYDEYVCPENEKDVTAFFPGKLPARIVSDPILDDVDTRKNAHVNYRLLRDQHYSLFQKTGRPVRMGGNARHLLLARVY